MIKKHIGKKLLLLGTSIASTSIVKYAQSQGAFVIVTDNLDPRHSAAKQIADKAENVSTRDIDALCEMAKKEKIDGVFCGVSEGNLLAAMHVCNKLGLPCYFTEKQWELCQNKRAFKELCIAYGIPTPKEYKIDGVKDKIISEIQFPVIVKPVDGSAAMGITICHNLEELSVAYEIAKKESINGNVIVEEYVTGIEITSVYTINDGKISLSLLRDRYPSMDHPGVTAQFDASIAPSQFYKSYLANVDQSVKRMLQSIGIKVGSVFFQGIANQNGIYFFECGLRINALCDYYNISKLTRQNYMELMVDYTLTGKYSNFEIELEQPNPNQFCCIFNMTAHQGKIGFLSGCEESKKLPYVINAEFLLSPGRIINEDNSMAQSIFRAHINAPNRNTLQETISQMQRIVQVKNTNGENMLFLPFDVNRIIDTVSKQLL